MMASSSGQFKVNVLMAKGKRAAAAYIHADCFNTPCPKHLNAVLDNLLNPLKSIDEWETIDWCKWLIAGGRTPDEFASIVRAYDNATTCGLVWTPNFVAYRCRTCGISPCMSLCTDCFKKGNHHRHDFSMFLSQVGGACDCGDSSVMKETGFCDRHGPKKATNKIKAPNDLMCVAEAMMPRIIFRLILHLREHSNVSSTDNQKNPIQDADAYITMLLDFNNMGGVMRRVMTSALTNPQIYRILNELTFDDDGETAQFIIESKKFYEEALKSFPNPDIDDLKSCIELKEMHMHKSFLEELVFWTVKYEFPQRVVCLLLNMLPDSDYKEALTRAFVLHYSRISMMLERSKDPDTLSNRIVHVSVQLFSNEKLALKMANEMNLLHEMLISLKLMMVKILKKNTLHDSKLNSHYVVDCGSTVMKEHCYWPLVSDLNNVLSHGPVALKFMGDDSLLELWFEFLSMFQGMNVNQREMSTHVEFEPNTYYAAFSAELEASAYPMWTLVSHLTDGSTSNLTMKILSICLNELKRFLDGIYFQGPNVNDHLQVSFHLPLHRYFSVFLCQAVAKQGVNLDSVLPSNDTLWLMMMHPLRVQVAFYEILNGLWVRNGLQIKGQAMTYIQCNFCNSMVDADLYLLQIACTRCSANAFINTVIDKFHVKEWMSLNTTNSPQNPYLESEYDTPMLESFLTFLATLVSVRTNIGLSERDLNRLEMITLLCMGDKTHSELLEFLPEHCGASQSRDFETLLAEVADYRPPAPLESSGNLQQGMYSPKANVWEHHYDPIHVLLRAVHRRDFQTSMDRYTEYLKHANKLKPGVTSPWPPFRNPTDCSSAYDDPRLILRSRVFHAAALIILHKAVRGTVSEHIIALVIFLLDQAVTVSTINSNTMCSTQHQHHNIESAYLMSSSGSGSTPPNDMDLENFFHTDSLFENLTKIVGKIALTPEPEVYPMTYSSDSDIEWENSEADTEMGDGRNQGTTISNVLMLENWNRNDSMQVDDVTRDDALMLALPASEEMARMAVDVDDDDDEVGEADGGSSMAVAVPNSLVRARHQDNEEEVVVVDEEEEFDEDEEQQRTPALPAPERLPALTAGNEVGRMWSESTSIPTVSTNTTDLIPSTSGVTHHKNYIYKRRTPSDQPPSPPTVKLNESIISLLLKLHSQLSGIPDSYNPNVDDHEDEEEVAEDMATDSTDVANSLIGDGPFFIGKLLKRIASADTNCKKIIQETRLHLWPTQEEREEAKKQRENREREERRRRAKERQQKLMAEFATKQKQFMEKTMESEFQQQNISDDNEVLVSKQEYDCVICGQSTPSTEDKPMGLVVLVQATSVIGHRRRHGQPERSVLPTCDEERVLLRRDDTLVAEFDRRLEELDRHFDPKSWYLSVNVGWDGGVHVQTCGHHLHLDCLNSYLQSLRSQQRQLNLSPEKGEYLCPLCRQLANSVLPLAPQLGDCAQMVRSKPSSMLQVLDELNEFLQENDQKPSNTNMAEAIGKIMEVMTSSTQLKPMFKQKGDKPIPQSLFLFVTSIARTNLEVELIQRGGDLVNTSNQSTNPLLPKRDCIVPLLHVLSVHARVARVLAMWPAWMIFQQLCGALPTSTALTPIESEVPLLLKDPIALLLQFVLLLPLHLDQIYFTTTVQMVYNLLYYQVIAQLSCGLTTSERMRIQRGRNTFGRINNLASAFGLIEDCLGGTDLYMEDDGAGFSGQPDINTHLFEQQVERLCLPFLRIAALLKLHLYQQPLPEIRSDNVGQNDEFLRLIDYLDLIQDSNLSNNDLDQFNTTLTLNWPDDGITQMYRTAPTAWCNQFAVFVNRSQIAARSFLMDLHVTWHPPRLLQLPREYEKIFTYYHKRPCSQCHSVSSESSICLLCGTVVCLKQLCCKQQNICEATAHALECGAGTGVFLVITTTYIIVIRGHRACLWGSLYLDEFEEEDRDLKRGKPLYLSQDRYKVLEQQWLAHRFDHTKKTWVQHRNAL